MDKLRVYRDKDKVGWYYHDSYGTHYASVYNSKGRKCVCCGIESSRGIKQAKSGNFWCNNCVTVLNE